MAIIECVECGNEISDLSEICPKCGCKTSRSIPGNCPYCDLLEHKTIEMYYRKETREFVCPKCQKTCRLSTLEDEKKWELQKQAQQNIPHCPICQSTDLSKISATKKVAKIAAFGIFGMGDNGKTWKCNNCGSKF